MTATGQVVYFFFGKQNLFVLKESGSIDWSKGRKQC